MEKQRCWQTIQNNRLYAKLKNIAMVNKLGLKDNEIDELNDVFKLYIKHGVKYSDKMNDFPIDELTKNIESMREEINIEPKVRERNVQIEKLKTPRKPKSTMIIKTVTKSSKSGSMTLQIPKSVKSNMRGGGSSVNSTIKALQELESAFT